MAAGSQKTSFPGRSAGVSPSQVSEKARSLTDGTRRGERGQAYERRERRARGAKDGSGGPKTACSGRSAGASPSQVSEAPEMSIVLKRAPYIESLRFTLNPPPPQHHNHAPGGAEEVSCQARRSSSRTRACNKLPEGGDHRRADVVPVSSVKCQLSGRNTYFGKLTRAATHG